MFELDKNESISLNLITKHSLKNLILELPKRFARDNISQTGGQLAYFFLLSVFPFLIFLNALLGFLNISVESIIREISAIAPEEIVVLLRGYLESVVETRNTSLLSIGLLASIFSASKAVDSLIIALNTAYDVENKRNFITKKAVSIFFTLILGFAIVISLLLPALGKNVAFLIADFFRISNIIVFVWVYIRWVIVFFILFITIALLYHIVPYVNQPFKNSLPGTFFAVTSWLLVSYGFGIYVNNFANYSAVYGSIGAVIALMFWLYLTGIILVLGGEINDILYRYYEASNSKHDEVKIAPKTDEAILDDKFNELKETLIDSN